MFRSPLFLELNQLMTICTWLTASIFVVTTLSFSSLSMQEHAFVAGHSQPC